MKTAASYLRVLAFMVIAFLLLELTVDSGDQMAIEKYPIIWGVLAVIFLFALTIFTTSRYTRAVRRRNAELRHEIDENAIDDI